MIIVPGWKNIRYRIKQRTGILCSIKIAKCIRDGNIDSLNDDELKLVKSITESWSLILDGDEIDSVIFDFYFRFTFIENIELVKE